jgi:hypothetical protein
MRSPLITSAFSVPIRITVQIPGHFNAIARGGEFDTVNPFYYPTTEEKMGLLLQ